MNIRISGRQVRVCAVVTTLWIALAPLDAAAGLIREKFNEVVEKIKETVEENNPILVVADGESVTIDDDRNLFQVLNNGTIKITGSPTELLAFRNYEDLFIEGQLKTQVLVGRLLNEGGSVVIRRGGTLRNNGSTRNSGSINVSNGTLVNNALINNIRLDGSTGSVSVGAAGALTNNFVLINLPGNVSVAGELFNRGLLGQRRGTMSVSGDLFNIDVDAFAAIFSNVNGSVTAFSRSRLINGGIFSNRGEDARVNSLGTFDNDAVLLNRNATLNVHDMTNGGLLANSNGARMTVGGVMSNDGLLLVDEGTLTIGGSFLNKAPADALIVRDANGVIQVAPTLVNLEVVEEKKLTEAFRDVSTIGDVVDGIDFELSDISRPTIEIKTLLTNVFDSGFLVNSGGDVVVNGELRNQGFMLNRSERLGSRRAEFTVNGIVANDASFFNFGANLGVAEGGSFVNQGLLFNRDKLFGAGRINVNGSLNNRLYMSNIGGTVNVTGLLRNHGVLVNRAELFVNPGQFNVKQGGVLDNQGLLLNRNSDLSIGSALGTALINGVERNGLVLFDADGNVDFAASFSNAGGLLSDIDQLSTDLVLDVELLSIAQAIAERALFLNSSGSVTINGTLTNQSVFTNRSGGQVDLNGAGSNYGLLDNRNATIVIGGTLENFATLANRTSIFGRGRVTVAGTLANRLLTLNRGADLEITGVMENTGALVNINKRLPLNTGLVDVMGELTNAGLIYNTGTLEAHGSVINADTGVIFNTAALIGAGQVQVFSELRNDGFYLNREGRLTIDVDALFENNRLLRNRGDRGLLASIATIENHGELANNAYLLNQGDLTNVGALDNNVDSLVLNLGTVNNAVEKLEKGAKAKEPSVGTVVNRGFWVDIAGATTLSTDYEIPVTSRLPIDKLPFELPDVSIPLPSVDLLQASGATVNRGVFENASYVLNFGEFKNSDVGSLSNEFLLLNAGASNVTLQTEFLSIATETSEVPLLNNAGSLANNSYIVNLGTLANAGEVINEGFLFNLAGNAGLDAAVTIRGKSAALTGTLQAQGLLQNFGVFTNHTLIVNAGEINNVGERNADNSEGGEEPKPPGSLINLGLFVNAGVDAPELAPSEGTLGELGGGSDPDGHFSFGELDLALSLTGSGVLRNHGLFDNGAEATPALMLNLGQLDNRETGVFTNRGALINTPVGALDALANLPLLTDNFQQLDDLDDLLPVPLEGLERYFAADAGATVNAGTLHNTRHGLILSLGRFDNVAGGVIENEGILSVASLARLMGAAGEPSEVGFFNEGLLVTQNSGQLINDGRFRNAGKMVFRTPPGSAPSALLNSGDLRNEGRMEFFGASTFANAGTFVNAGVLQTQTVPFANANRLVLARGSRINGNVVNLGTAQLAGTQRTSIAGTFSSGPGSVLEVEFATKGRGRYEFGKLDVSALGLFRPDEVLLVNDGDFSFDHLKNNDRLRIISSSAPVLAASGPAALKNNAGNANGIWQFRYDVSNLQGGLPAPGVDVVFSRRSVRSIVNAPLAQADTSPGSPDVPQQPRQPWYAPAADAVDTLYERNDSLELPESSMSILSAFNRLGTSEEIVAAVAQLAPAVVNSGKQAVVRSFDALNSIVANRITATRQMQAPEPAALALLASAAHSFSGHAAGLQAMQTSQPAYHGKNLWVKVYGGRGDQDASRGADGYDSRTAGIFLGVDGPVRDALRVGAGFSYSQGSVDQNGLTASQDVEIDSYGATVYADYLTRNELYMTVSSTLGRNRYVSTRHIGIATASETARADYDGTYLLANVTIGKSLALSDSFSVHPSLGIEYSRLAHDGFTETEAGDFGQRIASDRIESLVYGARAMLTYRSEDSVVNLYAGVGYDSSQDQAVVDATFSAGAAYTLVGVDPGRYIGHAGLGFVHHVSDRFSLLLDYDLYDRKHYRGQTFAATARWAF